MRSRRVFVSLLVLLAILGLTLDVAAQSETRQVTDDEVNAIAKDLYCPVCESTPLDVCPTQACADWREVIRTKLEQGETKEEIRAYFERQYGARALSEPPLSGFTTVIWVIPIIVGVVAIFFFGRYLSRLRSGGEAVAPAATAAGTADAELGMDDYHKRIEQELREL